MYGLQLFIYSERMIGIYVFVLIVGVVSAVDVCSASCDYRWWSMNYSSTAGCLSTNVNSCKYCDTNYYDGLAVGGVCIQSANSIYNSTVQIPTTVGAQGSGATFEYQNSSDVDDLTVDGHNCIYLQGEVTLVIAVNYPIPSSAIQGHYALRFKVLMYNTHATAATFTFYVLNHLHEPIPIMNVIEPTKYDRYWVYTSSQVKYTLPTANIIIGRADNLGDQVGSMGFCDLRMMVAYCVPNCLECTSLTTCTKCHMDYQLDPTTKMCVTECPLSTFASEVYAYAYQFQCLSCDKQCLVCEGISSNCSSCTESGIYQAFLIDNTCYRGSCPNGYLKDYETHTCQCPQGYFIDGVVCSQCDPVCSTCQLSSTSCLTCATGYFRANASYSCGVSCPSGEYAVGSLTVCYMCSNHCKQCVNSSILCTSCYDNGRNRYLYNNACLSSCPDGYIANTVDYLCEQCPLGKFSYKGKCYSSCPTSYTADITLRSCIIQDGYPLSIQMEVLSKELLQLTIEFSQQLNPNWVLYLSEPINWLNFVSLYVQTNEAQSPTHSRLLQEDRQLDIQTLEIGSDRMVITTGDNHPQQLSPTHSFYVVFDDNLDSPEGAIYRIDGTYDLADSPWIVRQFYEYNLSKLFLVGTCLGLVVFILLFLRVEKAYKVSVELLQCFQLLGLSIWAAYPHSMNLELYSFLLGFDFTNFSFMYNFPRAYVPACADCESLSSYAFIQGDMDWLRMTGSLLLSMAPIYIIWFLLSKIKRTKEYSQYYFLLACDLLLIKALHSWFASLIYVGLNLSSTSGNTDFVIFFMHLLSYGLLVPLLRVKIGQMRETKQINLSLFVTALIVFMLCFLSVAPTLISCLIVLLALLEFALAASFRKAQGQPMLAIKPRQTIKSVPVSNRTDKTGTSKKKSRRLQAMSLSDGFNQEAANPEPEPEAESKPFFPIPFSKNFNFYLSRCIKPICTFMIGMLVMMESQISMPFVGIVCGLLCMLALIDIYVLSPPSSRMAPASNRVSPAPSNNQNSMNLTMQDLKSHKDEPCLQKVSEQDDGESADDNRATRYEKWNKTALSHKISSNKILFEDIEDLKSN